MSEIFNPYHLWLGLAVETGRPNHYELLGLSPGESDAKKIALAAEQAATRIRSFRPGAHAADWARLLDEVQAAKLTLLDPARKAKYDRSVGLKPGPSTDVGSHGGSQSLADMFPPGFRPAVEAPMPAATVARTTPSSAPVSPAPVQPAATELWNELPPAAQPMMPAAQPMMPAPMGVPQVYNVPYAVPVAASLSTGAMPPGYPQAAATFAPGYPAAMAATPYGATMPIDPMAPVAIPGVTAAFAAAPVPTGYPLGTAIGGLPTAVPMAQPIAPHAAMPVAALPATPVAAASPASPIAAAPETPGVRTASAASVMLAARKERQTRSAALLAGGAAGLVIVAGLGAYVVITSNGNKPEEREVAQGGPKAPESKPAANAANGEGLVKPGNGQTTFRPVVPTTKDAQVAPPPVDPRPMPAPKPMPAPDPEPEPKPEPKPAPAPAAKPTRQQVVELEAALKRARLALSEQSFDDASAQAAAAEKAAVLPEHRAMVERLRLAIDHTRLFREALAEAAAKFEAAETIKVGSSTVVSIVETFPDKITVRVNGMNRTYSFATIAPGLAVAIMNTKRIGGEPDSRILNAMFVATAKDADAEDVAEARGWLEQLESSDPAAAMLLAFLDDSYDGIVAAFDAAQKDAAGGNSAAAMTN